MVTKVCVTSVEKSLSPAQCIFRRYALHAGGPLLGFPNPPLGLLVACVSGVRGFVVLGGEGSGSSIPSVELTVTRNIGEKDTREKRIENNILRVMEGQLTTCVRLSVCPSVCHLILLLCLSILLI